MRILVTGDRNYDNEHIVRGMLSAIVATVPDNEDITIVEGGARGAHHLAWRFGSIHEGICHERHPADWDTHGKAAGFIRNKAMADLGADVCIAFKDNFDYSLSRGGTENMVKLAKDAGTPVYLVSMP